LEISQEKLLKILDIEVCCGEIVCEHVGSFWLSFLAGNHYEAFESIERKQFLPYSLPSNNSRGHLVNFKR
jgi:hypothetical protein